MGDALHALMVHVHDVDVWQMAYWILIGLLIEWVINESRYEQGKKHRR